MPTLDIAVAASADDATQLNTTMTINGTNIRINANTVRAGFRFLNVTVPVAATITVAYITIERGSASASPNVTIYCEDVDDAATFTTAASNITGRPLTTANTVWNAALGGVAGDRFNSPSIVGAVQEVIDRAGWASGNDLNVLFFGITGGDVQIRTYDNAVADAAALHLEYTTGGGSPVSINAGLGALTIGELTAAVLASGTATIAAALGSLIVAELPATVTVSGSTSITAQLGTLTLTGLSATVSAGAAHRTINAALGALSVAGLAGTVQTTPLGIVVNANVGVLSLTGLAGVVSVTGNAPVAANLGLLVIMGLSANVVAGTFGTPAERVYVIAAEQRVYAIAGEERVIAIAVDSRMLSITR